MDPHTPASGSDPTLAESTALVPTRLGRLHVRLVGQGPTTVLWSSMFVDSHTWDPVVPLLPRDRRYALVDPPGLGLSESLREASDIAGAADAATDLLAGLGVDGPVDWVGNAFGGHVGFKARGATGSAAQSQAVTTRPACRRPASAADHAPAPGPSGCGARGAGAHGDPHGHAHRRLARQRASASGGGGVLGAPHPPQHGPGRPVLHPQPGRRHC